MASAGKFVLRRRDWHLHCLRAVAVGLLLGGGPHGLAFAAEPAESATPVVEAVEIGAVRAQTGGLLLSGQAGGTIEGALIWSLAGRDENGRAGVPFVIEVDGAGLLAGHIGGRIVFGVYAYVVDPEGRVVDHTVQAVILDSATYASRINGSGLKFIGNFSLDPGKYTLRVMVQNNATMDYFMSWSIVTVSAADEPEPHLLPPLFQDPDSAWVVARQSGGESTVSLSSESVLVPAARPVLMENNPTEIFLGGGGWSSGALVEVHLVNDVGRTVSEPMVDFSSPPGGDFEFRRGVLSPVDVPPGEYSLIVKLVDDESSEVLRRALRVIVVGEGELRRWTGAGPGDLATAEGGPFDPEEEAPKVSKKEIRSTYREALVLLGDGDTLAARRLVAELERRATAKPSRSAVLNLGEAEYAEAKELAKTDPDCLMLMALLHRDLYRGYAARLEGVLATHSRAMAVAYAEDLGRLKQSAGFPEGLMVNFASDLAQAGSFAAAEDLLERALLVNSSYSAALLSLGFSFERASDYLEACAVYQELVDEHPESQEGQLRLGINLIRTGRDKEGQRVLRGLFDGQTTPWVEAVAAQELVRSLSAKKKWQAEAETAARAALERMPEDQRLWVLLAALLDRRNRHGEAMEILADLPPAGRGVSPRARYAEWPALDVSASQVRLTEWANAAVPALRAALAAEGDVP